MSDALSSYKFILDGIEVNPIIGNEFSLNWAKEEGSYYFRRKLANEIKLTGTDYYTVSEAAITKEFTFLIQKYENSVWVDYYLGRFYKTDCEFDEDLQILTVTPAPNDGWDDVKKVINNQYDILQLLPERTRVNFKIRPILQIIVGFGIPSGVILNEGMDRITNIQGSTLWDEEIPQVEDRADLVNIYGFTEVFISYAPLIGVTFYERYLTTEETFNGVGTTPRASDDISSANEIYKYISQEIISGGEVAYNTYQDDPEIYGRIRSPWDTIVGTIRYYAKYTQPSFLAITVNPTRWRDASYWYLVNPTIINYELTNSTEVVLDDGLEFASVIQVLLDQETNIVFEASTDFSEFFYATNNPVSGQPQRDIIITPKSNIRLAFYSDPARKASIKLTEIFQMLAAVWDVYWHIEKTETGEQRLRLEHISWYENGGSYSGPSISLDTTATYDARNGLPISFDQNKFKYNKSELVQRYEFRWMDEVSDVFDGQPIRVLDKQVEDGVVVNKNADVFTSDIDMIIAKEDISLDGFALLICDSVAGSLEVPIDSIQVEGVSIPIQNVYGSFLHLHPNYQLNNKASYNLEVNGVATTALSIKRTKQQEVDFPFAEFEIDPMGLITTGLGSGQINNMSLNLVNNKYEITLNHDTE